MNLAHAVTTVAPNNSKIRGDALRIVESQQNRQTQSSAEARVQASLGGHGLCFIDDRWLSKFEQRVELDFDGCWKYVGKKLGYSKVYLDCQSIYAHRLSYLIFVGLIRDGLFVLHRCDNPSCVRPSHLFLGTQKENMQDALKKGRIVVPGLSGESHPQHKLTMKKANQIRGLGDRYSQRKLAKKFHISQSQILAVLKDRAWKN